MCVCTVHARVNIHEYESEKNRNYLVFDEHIEEVREESGDVSLHVNIMHQAIHLYMCTHMCVILIGLLHIV